MTEQTEGAEVLTEAEKDALWEAIERAFLDTTIYSQAAQDNVERTVARLIAAAEVRGAQAALLDLAANAGRMPADASKAAAWLRARAAAAAAGGGGEARPGPGEPPDDELAYGSRTGR